MDEEIELLCEVARLYYENNLTQNEIANQIHTSRSTVSRLLQEARDKGVVEIIIHYPWERLTQLEQDFRERFQLRDALIVNGRGCMDEEVNKCVYVLAARYIQNNLKESTSLGISWGRAVYHTIQMLRPAHHLSIKVIQLFGASNSQNRFTDGPDLVRQLATIYGGECHYIHAPLFVDNSQAHTALLQDQHIQETLDLARKADIVLTGIGSLEQGNSFSPTWSSYLSAEVIDNLIANGAIGHICARHYDIHGSVLSTDIHKGIIGIDLPSIHKVPKVIGVATGEDKARAILGALRGKHINILVTNDVTAKRVLELDQQSD